MLRCDGQGMIAPIVNRKFLSLANVALDGAHHAGDSP